jgi:ethanolamine transporter EutH
VKTLETQFIWICIVLLIGAFLLAFLLSRYISRPIADMNKVKIESKSDAEHVLTMPAYSSIIIEL